MFAVVQASGKQYRVSINDKIIVNKIEGEAGSKVTLDNVLFLKNAQGESVFGDPILPNAKVEAEVVRSYKDKKVIAFKKRRRKNSRRKRGHRQQLTELKILSINLN